MLGRVSPHQLFLTERQATFTKKVNHLHKLGSILHNLDAGFPSRWSHFGTTTWARILENGGQHLPSAWAPQSCAAHRPWTTIHPFVPSYTALLQLSFSPERAASPRKIIKVPETHEGAFRVSYKVSWNCPAVNWPLTFQAESPGSTEELAPNKRTAKQVYGLRNLNKSKAISFLDGLSQPDSILSAWGFFVGFWVVFFFLSLF